MRQYLSDIIATQSARRREKVYDLLEEARIGKQQLDVLLQRLKSSVSGNSPLIMTEEARDSVINSEGITNNTRQVNLRIREMYRISNLISLLLSSHAVILSSEVKGLEEDLATMEKMAKNYAFLLSDAKAFDYANLEPFNDYNNMQRDVTEQAPDRTGSRFGPNDVVKINKKEGVVTLPSARTISYNIYPRVVSSNFVVDTKHLSNTTKANAVEGWKSDYISSSRISTSLPGTSAEPGAQIILEYDLPQPQAASSIKLSPFSNIPIHVEGVKVFLSEDSDPIQLLDGPIFLDRDFEIPFQLGTVSRFQIHLNQRTFTRATEIEGQETRTRDTLNRLGNRSRYQPTKEIEDKLLRDNSTNRLGSFTSRDFSAELSQVSDKTKPSIDQFLRRILWDGIDVYNNISSTSRVLEDADVVMQNRPAPALGQDPIGDVYMIQPYPLPRIIRDGYRYTVGLKSVSLTLESPSFRGVFVSSSLRAEGDIGHIRLKAEDSQYISPRIDLDNKTLTSVEYSITNDPDPIRESDWKPILPVGRSEVESERLFPNEYGRCVFRFQADRQELMLVYKNGIQFSNFEPVYTGDKTTIQGIRIPVGEVGDNDIFTASYLPFKEATLLKLDEVTSFDNLPLTTAFDSNGAGEFFGSTGEKNSVTLAHAPYIDRAEALSNEGYEPVTVVVEDGKPAINITDYTNETAGSFPDDDESYYYIQSGRKLLFNKQVDNFRVYYQYLENNVKFRVVLRCNSREFVSPKVDYVHVKAKIRKPDQSL